jgi:large repetitive protein
LEENFAAPQFFNVVDVLFRAGAAGEVRLDGKLSEVPSGADPTVTRNLGVALYSTTSYITDPASIILPTNLRINIIDELTAFSDNFTLVEDSPATVLDVLANDRDRENRAFSITSVNNTSPLGTASITNNGTRVTFTPTANASGPAVFTYTIRNSANNESTATVTVNLTPLNDPPIPQTPTLSIGEDAVAPGLLVNASQLFTAGPEDEVVAGQTVALTGTPTATNGTASITGTGQLSFVPAPDFFGAATVVVTGRDSDNATTTATFTVNVTPVNDAPTAGTTSFSIVEDSTTPLSIPSASLFNPGPANESSQTVTVSIVTGPTTAQGTAAVQGGALVFTPAPNFSGPVTIVLQGTDNGVTGTTADPLSSNSTITITVTAVNDDPDAVNDALAVTGISTAQALDVLANDSAGPQEQTDTIRVTAVTQPPAGTGTVAIGPNGSNILFTPVDGVFDRTVAFTYTIIDGGGLTDTATVEVYIAPPARPYALDDTIRVAEDTLTSTSLNLLANDFFRAGSNGVLNAVNSVPAGQSPLIPASQGALTIAGNNVGFIPTANFFGNVALLTYSMNDDSGQAPEIGSRQVATVTIIVTEVNDAPTASNLNRATDEDTALSMTGTSITTGLSRGPNEESQTLTITGARVDAASGTVSLLNGDLVFTPAQDFFGTALVEYTVTDNGTTNGAPAPLSSTGSRANPQVVLGSGRHRSNVGDF